MSNYKKKKGKNKDYHYQDRRDEEQRYEREAPKRAKEKRKNTELFISALVGLIITFVFALLSMQGKFPYGDFIAYAVGSASFFILRAYYKEKRDGLSKLCLVFGFVCAFVFLYLGYKYLPAGTFNFNLSMMGND